MNAIARVFAGLIWLVFAGSIASAEPAPPGRSGAASPISAELAKKCRALAVQAHPRQPAGAKSGHEQAQRDYFRNCIAKGGNVRN